LGLAACLLGVFSSGLLRYVVGQPGPPPQLDTAPREVVTVTGCVVEPPVFYEGRDQFVLELAPSARARVSLYLGKGEPPPELLYGQRVEVDGTVRRVRNFQNPGAFDYAFYLARSGIYWTISGRGGPALRVVPGSCGSPFWKAIFSLRMAGLASIERLYAGNPYAIGMMQGVLLGDSTKLEKVWTDHFRRTGTYHALVISGLHVVVLAGVLLFFLRILFVPELGALFLTALAAWLYALVSGWQAPVVRAAGGFTLYLAARYFYRRGRILNLLAAVAIAYLALDPNQLFDASFQLSFLSVAAIGALAAPFLERTVEPLARGVPGLLDTSRDPRLEPRTAQFRVETRLLIETVAEWTRIPEPWVGAPAGILLRVTFRAWESVVISTVIQIGLALPMAVYFHRVSLSGLSANLLVAPLLSAVVPLGFMAIFTGWRWMAALAGRLLEWSQAVVDLHMRWEPNWRIPDPPLWLALAFVGSLLVLALLVDASKAWRRLATAAVLASFAVLVWCRFAPRLESGALEYTVIDVGQGDSMFLAFPNGATMLVDGGGIPVFGSGRKPRMDVGEDVVAPYLWSRRLRRLDIIAATHLHTDHAGGLPALIEDFRPREVWIGVVEECPEWRAIEEKARAVGARIVEMREGRQAGFGGARVEVLWPSPGYRPTGAAENNDSLVLRVSYGRHSFLLMGDADRRVEASIPLAPADVLKVAHHGSRTATSRKFLDVVRPSWAVISVGEDNAYRNPHPDTLERLAEFSVAVFRTDADGLVSIRTDGRRFTTETQRSRREAW
jgi:competence protein ComEC